ncbi:hypothetical protein PACTADRAFT_33386 [Pachysolen tannophilus NRRL Y-2460]|uniref:DNA mismatch repair protein S5 domain-containing protein n=1 Tax=Pachysolen tannophilus NRRL Y-2460 TaxID=669874 RepID=A0A1E4TX19_PACTA|nr:hypothetical protein PACTADRAFT_33386 [Pachysolen tannophilus NRRL Y-2460]
MPIKRISQQTVSSLSSIASVFNVTSVVKELIDNSLDADSSHINIEVDYETGGLRHCLVRDNGCGVTKLDRPLMCCNCTTSKLSSNSEITKKSIFANVSTLGFRGEALFFISQLISVSDNRSGSRSGSRNGSMTITTRTAKDQMGEMWSIMGQGLPDGLPKSVAAAIGTCITLEGLFSSSVVRKKLLMRQSRKTIEDIRKLIISYAMTYPELRFTFKLMEVKTNGEICISSHNNKNGLIINPCSSQLSLLSQQYQIRNPKNSFFEGEIETETKNCHNIQGEEEEVEYKLSYVLPLMNGTSEASSKNSNTFLAVNNRPLDLKSSVLFKEIRNMLNSVYEKLNLLRPNIWILNIIILNNENLDVNIEPAKNDVLIFKQKEFLRILENELHVIVANNHGLNYSDEFSNRIGKNKIKETENEEALDDSKYVVFRGSDSGSANSLKGPNDEFEISNEIADDETSNLNAIEISNDQDGKDWSFHTHDFFSQELIGNGDEIHSEARDGTNGANTDDYIFYKK